MAEIEKLHEEILALNYSINDIVDFVGVAGWGAVTRSKKDDYFARIHDTWGEKKGGRVHIDMGAEGWHLMLDRGNARKFIEFVKNRLENSSAKTSP